MTHTLHLGEGGKRGAVIVIDNPPTKRKELVARVRFVPFAGEALRFDALFWTQPLFGSVAVIDRCVPIFTR